MLFNFKKLFTSTILTSMLCLSAVLPNIASATPPSEVASVEQTIHNYYKSLREKDADLYLASIANSHLPAYQSYSTRIEGQEVTYNIEKSKKINDTKYEVSISKLKYTDGKDLPVVPYNVILEDGKWKLDLSSISIFPKDELKKITDAGKKIKSDSPFYKSIISENKDFFIRRPQQIEGGVSTRDWRTYAYGDRSADIYVPGVIAVTSFPDPNGEPNDQYNFVVAISRDAITGGEYSQTLSGVSEQTTYFYDYEYHNYDVYNFNYPWSTGKYNVVW